MSKSVLLWVPFDCEGLFCFGGHLFHMLLVCIIRCSQQFGHGFCVLDCVGIAHVVYSFWSVSLALLVTSLLQMWHVCGFPLSVFWI